MPVFHSSIPYTLRESARFEPNPDPTVLVIGGSCAARHTDSLQMSFHLLTSHCVSAALVKLHHRQRCYNAQQAPNEEQHCRTNDHGYTSLIVP